MLGAALARRLETVWYGNAPVPIVLSALERVYRAMLDIRRALYRGGWKRSERVDAPVVVVGNVTAGGTGKTPLVRWLVEELSGRGWKPGIVLRGYGGSARTARLVGARDDAAVVGDEAALLARCHTRAVAIGRRRADAARLLIEQAGCDVIVADDGLQHWALARDLEIAVVDGLRRCGNERLLPAGPLREPAARLDDVDYIVCNGGVARDGEIAMHVGGRHAVLLQDPSRVTTLSEFAGHDAHAVAGIGNPQRFFDLLRAAGIAITPHAWPDHHVFDGSELRFDDALPVFITEKDAVKCQAFAHARVYVVPVEAELPAAFADRIHSGLCALRDAASAAR
jgi:tetraacyldisaccharide 4'-kinase